MTNPVLYRRRLIPDECIPLKDDLILECNEERIVTSWNAIRPKKDLHHGFSCYFLKEGFKVSKFYYEDGRLLYWYCDIVSYDYSSTDNRLMVTDLLADVIIYPDGFVKVVDLDELVMEDSYLSFPTRFLCKVDCKGLCPYCGQALNEGDCGCRKPVDPRLAALQELLRDDE